MLEDPHFGHGRADLVRHIEVMYKHDGTFWSDDLHLRGILKVAKSLSRLKTVTIGYDKLGDATSASIVKYLRGAGVWGLGLRCTGIGQFRVGEGKQSQIRFKHYGICREWQRLMATNERADSALEYEAYAEAFERKYFEDKIRAIWDVGLRDWLVLYEGWRVLRAEGGLPDSSFMAGRAEPAKRIEDRYDGERLKPIALSSLRMSGTAY